MRTRRQLKRALALGRSHAPARGLTILTYHRVGGGSPDELDVDVESFRRQVEILAEHRVVPLDTALDELEAGDDSPKVVLTFDDGFEDVHRNAWPLLRDLGLPLTLYLATAYVDRPMVWEGARGSGTGRGLTWEQVADMTASGLVTVGAHTHRHTRPDHIGLEDLLWCDHAIEEHLGVRPEHFAWPWGLVGAAAEPHVRERYRSAVTGEVGRNQPGVDPFRLRRVPVRASDPPEFFEAKLTGHLLPERAYGAVVDVAKAALRRAPGPAEDGAEDEAEDGAASEAAATR